MENRRKEKNNDIPLRTNLPDIKIPESLRSWNSQNYSDLINKPKKKKHFSFKPPNFLHINNHKIISLEDKIDFSKLYSNTLAINPETSYSSINEKQTLQYLIQQDYGNYVKLIKKIYPSFKFNHYSKYFEQIKQAKCQTENNNDGYRRFLFTNIDKAYLVEHEKYTISSKILEENKEILEAKSKELVSQVGEIELRINKILEQNSMMESYIEENLYIEKTINSFLNTISGKKKEKQIFQQKNMMISSKLIMKQQKKENLIKLIKDSKKIQKIVKAFSQLTAQKQLNCKEENEIVSSIKHELSILRNQYKNQNLKVIQIIDKEIQTLNDKSETKYIDEFGNQFKALFIICLNTNEECITEELKETKYDLSDNPIEIEINKAFLFSSFPSNTRSLIINLLDIFGIIISENFDISLIIDKIKEIMKEILIRIYNSEKEKAEALSSKLFATISNYHYIVRLLQNNYAVSPKMFNELTKYIYQETKNTIIQAITPLIEKIINKNLDFEQFLKIKEELLSKTKILFDLLQLNQKDCFTQYDNDYIFLFFETYSEKIQTELEKEEWIQITQFSSSYQTMITIIMKDYHSQNKDSFITTSSEEKIDLLILDESNYKMLSINLFLIDFIYKTYQILFYINNPKHNQTIVLQMCKILSLLLSKSKDIFIEGDGKINKNRSITEKEFLLLNSSVCFFEKILYNFNTFFLEENDEIIINQVNKTIKKFNEMHKICSDTIINIIQSVSDETINEFKQLDFANYPFFTEKEYNSYIKKFSKLKKVYDSMIGCFENYDITEIYNKILNTFINNFYSLVISKGRIEPDTMLRQFRNEMIYMRKLLKMFDLINTEEIREKIETISKMVNPNKIAKKKKDKNKEIKNNE